MKKKILIRSGMTPLQKLSTEKIMTQNLIGHNVGNLIYAYGVYRALMVSEDVKFVPNHYKYRIEDVRWINENCKSFIIPMADMFRNGAEIHMQQMTKQIRRLKIPCVITGVGVRAGLDMDVSQGYPFDDTVKELLDAVLDKSAMIGVRGEITGKYLSSLGYKEGKHYMVIGCPSMYGCGNRLKRRELHLNKDSRVSVNMSVMSTDKALNYLTRILEEMPNSYFLPQRLDELWLLYTGRTYMHNQGHPMYPTRITDRVYQEDRVKFFLHAKSWMNFLETMDLSVGGRMHGNLAAVQAGTPCILLPHDLRMTELADYHKIPHLPVNELNENWTLEELIEHVDFDSMYRCHEENFNRYISFLDMNGIDHIFKESGFVETAPLDLAISRMKLPGSVESVLHLSVEEMAMRWKKVYNNQTKCKKAECDEWKEKFELLNNSSIKRDAKCLKMKVGDKIKGRNRTNYERAAGLEH